MGHRVWRCLPTGRLSWSGSTYGSAVCRLDRIPSSRCAYGSSSSSGVWHSVRALMPNSAMSTWSGCVAESRSVRRRRHRRTCRLRCWAPASWPEVGVVDSACLWSRWWSGYISVSLSARRTGTYGPACGGRPESCRNTRRAAACVD